MDSFPYRSLDGIDFYFTICKGFEYNVEFSKADYLIESEKLNFLLYDISFDNSIKSGLRKQDLLSDLVSQKIRTTICKIIDDFITKNECTIVFICDSSDAMHKPRFGRFQKWEEEYASQCHSIWQIYEDIENDLIYYVGAIAFDEDQYAQIEVEMRAPFILSKDRQ